MATRVLTGVLAPKAGFEGGGTAVILFNPPAVFGDASGLELNASGAAGAYTAAPGKVLSLRHIKVADTVVDAGGNQIDTFNINDGAPTQNDMVVSWATSNGGEIREMSFLIVGEA